MGELTLKDLEGKSPYEQAKLMLERGDFDNCGFLEGLYPIYSPQVALFFKLKLHKNKMNLNHYFSHALIKSTSSIAGYMSYLENKLVGTPEEEVKREFLSQLSGKDFKRKKDETTAGQLLRYTAYNLNDIPTYLSVNLKKEIPLLKRKVDNKIPNNVKMLDRSLRAYIGCHSAGECVIPSQYKKEIKEHERIIELIGEFIIDGWGPTVEDVLEYADGVVPCAENGDIVMKGWKEVIPKFFETE